MKATATCRHVATTTEGGAKDSDVATTTEGAATTADVCYRRCLRRRCLGHLAAVRPANEPEPGQLCRAVLPQHPTWPHLPAAPQHLRLLAGDPATAATPRLPHRPHSPGGAVAGGGRAGIITRHAAVAPLAARMHASMNLNTSCFMLFMFIIIKIGHIEPTCNKNIKIRIPVQL